jgi:dTDP-glucose pyrophosphorylase
MNAKRVKDRSIRPDDSLLLALKKMDGAGVKSLLVVDDRDLFVGILSIGDIQRAIIRNESLQSRVAGILRPNPRVASPGASPEQVRDLMMKYRMEFLPLVDKSRNIVGVHFWEDLVAGRAKGPARPFALPVVIMAGGLGTRLQPFTNVLPKPLFPFGERTIIEEIIQRFTRHGCRDFHVSANYKADILEYYLQHLNLDCQVSYFREDKPLGTAGSLFLLKNRLQGTFFVTNCDIIIDQDYSEILEYHRDNRNAITIVAALKHFPIPYGILETGENGLLASLQEKPELTFKINSGMYILEAGVLAEIPDNTFFHITQLIEKVHARGANVGVFPVSEGSWTDIGDRAGQVNLPR